LLITIFPIYDSFRDISVVKGLGSGRAATFGDRFRRWKQTSFLLWTIVQKRFVFELCLVFFPTIVHSLTATGSSLASSLRFASLTIIIHNKCPINKTHLLLHPAFYKTYIRGEAEGLLPLLLPVKDKWKILYKIKNAINIGDGIKTIHLNEI